MIEEVVARGWLNPQPAKVKPERDLRAERHKKLLARLSKWESKLSRAETAIRKLKRQIAYYERSLPE